MMVRTIEVFVPGEAFPSVSITGSSCSMDCEHCSGQYLKGMRDVSAKGELFRWGMKLHEKGGKGMLVSGGCGPEGAVPFNDEVIDDIRKLKEETELGINIHSGLIEEDGAMKLSDAGVDVVSFDMIGDRSTIEEVLHLIKGVDDYEKTYEALLSSGLKVVPHVLAGLHFGELRGEFEAVDIISRHHPERVVLIVIVPTRGTPMERIRGPSNSDVFGLGSYMRKKLDSHLVLGCMRPRGRDEMEIGLLERGFDGIVLPSKGTRKYINEKGWEIVEYGSCCALGPI